MLPREKSSQSSAVIVWAGLIVLTSPYRICTSRLNSKIHLGTGFDDETRPTNRPYVSSKM